MRDTAVGHRNGPHHHHPHQQYGSDLAHLVAGLAHRFQLPEGVRKHHDDRLVLTTFVAVNAAVSMALISAIALATHEPFVFPSLGPTAFLLFYAARAPVASPRNAITGHLIGVVSGYLALLAMGLQNTPANLDRVTWPRLGAAAISLSLTAGVMVLLKAPHPPAGATTLIISLGMLNQLSQMGIVMGGVVVLVAQAFVVNRLAGIDYPLWSPSVSTQDGSVRP